MQFISFLEDEDEQNESTAHTTNSTVEMLEEFFGDSIIWRNVWPPSYPDCRHLTFIFRHF